VATSAATDERRMNDATDTAGLPTCPTCGATRERAATPYQEATAGFAIYTCVSCGAQFESWSTLSTPREDVHAGDPVTEQTSPRESSGRHP